MLRVIVFAALAVLLLRLWSLQVFEHGRYQVTAEGNRVREVVSQAPRGIIVDDQGKLLATNQTSLVITIDRSVLDRQSRFRPRGHRPARGGAAHDARRAERADPHLHRERSASRAGTARRTSRSRSPPTSRRRSRFRSSSIPSASRESPPTPRRCASTRRASLAAHEIGYTGPASQAQLADKKAGYTAQRRGRARPASRAATTTYLRGTAGVKKLAVDRYGRVSGTISATPAKAGDTVVLALDSGVQSLLEQSLANELTARPAAGQAGDDRQRGRARLAHRPGHRHGLAADVQPVGLHRRHQREGLRRR